MVRFKLKECIIRPFKKTDINALYKNIKSYNVIRYTTIPYPYKKKGAKEFVEEALKNYRKRKKTDIVFAIEINNEVNGAIGIHEIEEHKAKIGYWLNDKYWNKGIMSKVVKKVSSYAFNTLKLKRLEAPVHPKNIGSMKVLEKNGFKLEGKFMKYEYHRGKLSDTYFFGKVK